MRANLGVRFVPTIFAKQLLGCPVVSARYGSGPAGILPFRFRQEPIAYTAQVVGRQSHAVFDLPDRWIAHLFFGDALLFAQPSAVLSSQEPIDRRDRTLRLRTILGRISMFPVLTS